MSAPWTWAEPFAGAAACALRLVGGPDLTPPVAWMGGKRRYARAILDAMGVPETPPSRVLLADAGPWGWVWPLLLTPDDAARVAAVLRSWSFELPSEELAAGLWRTLVSLPPAKDLHERAAQWIWLQSRAASGVPVWWDAKRGAWRMGEEFKKARRGDRTVSQKGTARGVAGGMMTNPCTIADRVESLARAFADVEVSMHHGDAGGLAVPPGAVFVLDDPPYVGATGYGWDMPRAEVLDLARRQQDSGAECVAVCEAEPLEIADWHHLELTREGGKPEWLTLSRPPVRLPARQSSLFAEPA